MHCFYHNDLDGHCAGAIVKMAFPKCQMHEINYGYDFNKDVLEKIDRADEDDDIYIVDFSFMHGELEVLVADGYNVHWFDHHASAIKEMEEYEEKCPQFDAPSVYGSIHCALDPTKAGCEITWEELLGEEPMPRAVRWLGRWDVWDHSDPNTIPFHEGMEIMSTDPAKEMDSWIQLFVDELRTPQSAGTLVDMVLSVGHSANKGKIRYDDKIIKNAYYLPDWHGKRTVAVNSYCKDSYAAAADDPRFVEYEPEMFMWYYQTPSGAWLYSLRSYPGTDTSVREVAEKFGGGGHPGSAGFKHEELIIKPEVKND